MYMNILMNVVLGISLVIIVLVGIPILVDKIITIYFERKFEYQRRVIDHIGR